jgi:hypothetical protein
MPACEVPEPASIAADAAMSATSTRVIAFMFSVARGVVDRHLQRRGRGFESLSGVPMGWIDVTEAGS